MASFPQKKIHLRWHGASKAEVVILRTVQAGSPVQLWTSQDLIAGGYVHHLGPLDLLVSVYMYHLPSGRMILVFIGFSCHTSLALWKTTFLFPPKEFCKKGHHKVFILVWLPCKIVAPPPPPPPTHPPTTTNINIVSLLTRAFASNFCFHKIAIFIPQCSFTSRHANIFYWNFFKWQVRTHL
jgi:hypothetical protein